MSDLTVELNAYVLPPDHGVFKLFPGHKYRLAGQVVDLKTAFLDIRGLDTLSNRPGEWSDDDIRNIISADRLYQNLNKSKESRRPASQDTKRLRFLKSLLFDAKKGDLIVVPLGKGLDGAVAIGELSTAPGQLQQVSVADGDYQYLTYGRPINWWTTNEVRRRFSQRLNSSLHAPTAYHTIEREFREEIYLAAYKNFNYDDVYVASFPTSKDRLTSSDQASIGVWLNAIAVIHQKVLSEGSESVTEDFYSLGLNDSIVELELLRNSPWSAVMRTIGPLAFSALALYPMTVEAVPLSAFSHVSVVAKAVSGAADHCDIVVPPDLKEIAKGLGEGRYEASCRLGKRLKHSTTLHPDARLKRAKKSSK